MAGDGSSGDGSSGARRACVRVETAPVPCAGGYLHVYVDSGDGLVRKNTHSCSAPQRGWAGIQYTNTASGLGGAGAVAGCLIVTTGPEPDVGAGGVAILVDAGRGYELANNGTAGPPDTNARTLVNRCYESIAGLRIRGVAGGPWSGSVVFRPAAAATYTALRCVGCTGGSGTSARVLASTDVAVAGEAGGNMSAAARCLGGEACEFQLPGLPPIPEGAAGTDRFTTGTYGSTACAAPHDIPIRNKADCRAAASDRFFVIRSSDGRVRPPGCSMTMDRQVTYNPGPGGPHDTFMAVCIAGGPAPRTDGLIVYQGCFDRIDAVRVVNADSLQSAAWGGGPKPGEVTNAAFAHVPAYTAPGVAYGEAMPGGADWIGSVSFSTDGGATYGPGFLRTTPVPSSGPPAAAGTSDTSDTAAALPDANCLTMETLGLDAGDATARAEFTGASRLLDKKAMRKLATTTIQCAYGCSTATGSCVTGIFNGGMMECAMNDTETANARLLLDCLAGDEACNKDDACVQLTSALQPQVSAFGALAARRPRPTYIRVERVMIATSGELIGMRRWGDRQWSGEGRTAIELGSVNTTDAPGCGRLSVMIGVVAASKGCDTYCMDNCTFVIAPPARDTGSNTNTSTNTGSPGNGNGNGNGTGSNDGNGNGTAMPSPAPGQDQPPDTAGGTLGASDETSSTAASSSSSGDDGLGGGAIAGVVVGVLVVVVVVVVVALLAAWRTRQQDTPLDARVAELHTLLLKRVQAEFLLGYRQLIGDDVNSFDDYQEQIAAVTVKPRAITLGTELGRGNYGSVYNAVLKPASGSALGRNATTKGPLTVAVKMPVAPTLVQGEGAWEAEVERSAALLLEAFVMHGLKHPRIVSLVAVCTHTKPVLICMEHMRNGDLRTFLRRCRPSLLNPAANINHVAMAVIAVGVSSAMAFLERRRVIHRDVAARNVLVGATYADVKLGDLGAARNVKSKEDYTYIATTDHMPARWLPLEAIRDAAFSHKSDVFSFGVLMWEICTLGKPPCES